MSDSVDKARPCTLMILVEDPLETKFLELQLHRCDRLQFTIHEATSLPDALTCLATHRVDLVLVDEQMGLEPVGEIRQAGYRHPVIMLVGADPDLGRIFAGGATDLLTKEEVDPPALERAILAVLERSRLQSRLDRRSARLVEVNQALRTQNQEVQSFYQHLAEELGAPLASARELLRGLLATTPAPDAEELEECLQVVHSSLELMGIYVEDMVEVGHIEAGRITLQLQEGDLGELVRQVLERCADSIPHEGVTIGCRIAGDLPVLRFDRDKIGKVLGKLIDNALKYTSAGGRVQVAVEVHPEEPDFVRVSVTDTGEGIPPEDRERVFQRLYRGHGAISGGLGLGLNICHGLVVLHGGAIAVDGDPGGGSCFWFTLPRPAVEAVQEPAPTA